MTPRKRAALRAALQKRLDAALALGLAKIEPNRTDAVSVGVADEDAQALSEMVQTLSSQRNRQRGEEVARIRKALRKIDQTPDEYGLCEECEEEVLEARLMLVPEAPLCAECQAKRDPKRGTGRRNLTDFE